MVVEGGQDAIRVQYTLKIQFSASLQKWEVRESAHRSLKVIGLVALRSELLQNWELFMGKLDSLISLMKHDAAWCFKERVKQMN